MGVKGARGCACRASQRRPRHIELHVKTAKDMSEYRKNELHDSKKKDPGARLSSPRLIEKARKIPKILARRSVY